MRRVAAASPPASPAQRRDGSAAPATLVWSARTTWIWVALILAVGLALRLWLLPYRWINPDEGAHLMDGQLILRGLVPLVDFPSRQPLYAYLQAGMLALFPGGYQWARLLPVVEDMGTVVVIILLARRLFNTPVALVAGAIYAFHPLVVIWSPVVKTEPLTTLLSALAVYATARYIQDGDPWRSLTSAGVLLGLAYYVRQSSLAVALAVVVFLAVLHRRAPRRLLRAYGALAAGGLLIVVIAIAFYAPRMSAASLWYSPLNPLEFVLGSLGVSIGPSAAPTTPLGASALTVHQTWSATVRQLRETAELNLFLFAGLALSLGLLASFTVRRSSERRTASTALVLLYCWAFALMLAYGYWAMHRGYFTQYFNETIPPLAIVFAFTLWYLSHALAPLLRARASLLAAGGVLAVIFIVHRLSPDFALSNPVRVIVLAAVLALLYLGLTRPADWGVIVLAALVAILVGALASRVLPLRVASLVKLIMAAAAVGVIIVRGVPRAPGRSMRAAAFAGLVLLAYASVVTVAYAGRVMDTKYECVWSPETVARATRYIRAHTAPGDRILSGGMIWAVSAQRPPFLDISHPLAFVGGLSPRAVQQMRSALIAQPPRLIIRDGYTDRTFLSFLDPRGAFLASRYELKATLPGSYYPVQIYALREGAAAE